MANPADHVRPWAELDDDEKRLFCVGHAGADPISTRYRDAFRFTDGRIHTVTVDIGEQQYRDLEREAAAAFARE